MIRFSFGFGNEATDDQVRELSAVLGAEVERDDKGQIKGWGREYHGRIEDRLTGN